MAHLAVVGSHTVNGVADSFQFDQRDNFQGFRQILRRIQISKQDQRNYTKKVKNLKSSIIVIYLFFLDG